MLEIELFTTVLAAICGSDNIWQNSDEAMIQKCQTCPSFTSNAGNPGGEINQITYGSFTAPGIDEAVVDLGGCEAHVNNWGGSILLRSYDRNWSVVRYEPGVRSRYCLTVSHNEVDSLICENGYMNQGYVANWLDKLEFQNDRISTSQLLNVGSNIGSCRPPFYTVEIVKTQSQDINNDRLSDLVVTVSEAQELITGNESEEFRCETNLPEATLHQLTFLFDGQSFIPTSETVETIEYLKSIGL